MNSSDRRNGRSQVGIIIPHVSDSDLESIAFLLLLDCASTPVARGRGATTARVEGRGGRRQKREACTGV